jgi:hypothetical protein
MLIHNLLNHQELVDFLCAECRENNVGVNFSAAISPSDYLIIRIDAYFQQHLRERIPAGIDCLIVQRCANNDYKLYLVELKKIADLGGHNLNHIRSKFQNCFDVFMSDKFRDYFYDLNINFTSIQLIFVSTTNENKNRKDKFQKNTRLDALLAMRPCRFANKLYAISFEEPDPLVMPC